MLPGFRGSKSAKLRGVWPAIVVDNKDGDGNPGYRVKVKLPWLNDEETTCWARIAIPMGGRERGTYVLPEIDDQVLVAFEHGDIGRPIVLGALWSKQQEPVEVNQSGKNNTKLIKSRCGHRIIFDDKDGAERITIVDRTRKNKIVLDSANQLVKIESDGDIEVKAKTNVIIHAHALEIGTSDGVTGKGASLLSHAAKKFSLKATSSITIGGGNTTINVSSGAAAQVSGSGAGELGGAAAEAPKDQVAEQARGASSSGVGGGRSATGGGATGTSAGAGAGSAGAQGGSPLLAAAAMNAPAGNAAAAAAVPADLAQPLKPVNPQVTPPSLVVVVRKQAKNPSSGNVEPYTQPKRQAITLRTDAAFDGTATFTCDKLDRVKLFSAATGGHEIKFDGTDNVFKPGAKPAWATGSLPAGVKVFAEAVKPSDGLDDITAKLALSGGSKPTGPDARTTITSVEVTLQICKPRPAAGGDPPKLSQDDKVHVGRNVLVQNKARSFERAKLIIQQAKPPTFKGTLVLKAKNAHVAAYKDEKPKAGDAAVQFEIAADKILPAGEILWAEAESPSTNMRDTGFVLGIKGVEDDGDKVTATAVKIELDLCQSRTAKDAAPEPLPPEDKLVVGRFLHEQDTGNHHGRAQLIVRKIQPEKFAGTLTLAGVNANKVEIFPNELVTGGELATGLPHDIDYSPTDATKKNEDKKFWVQGKTGGVSLTLRDVALSLRLKDDTATSADRVNLTVIKFSTLKADIPSTPALHPRAGNSPVNRHEWKIADPAATKDHFSEDVAVNKPLVLIENSVRAADPIKLSVKVLPPGVPVNWAVIRDRRPAPDGDHKNLIALAGNREAPTLGSPARGLTNTLIANAVGSFHICPYVDCNDSKKLDFMTDDGKRIDREPFVMMNLVLVRVEAVSNDSKGQPNKCTPIPAAGQTAANFGGFKTGGWSGTDSGWYAKATVDVIGGGADGLRGLDRVFGGWIQHIFLNNINSSYLLPAPAPPPPPAPAPPAPPPRHHQYAFVSNLPDATHPGQYHYIGAAEAPVSAADAGIVIKTGPTIDNNQILDVSPYADAGTGGDSAVGSAGAEGGLPNPPRATGGPHGGGYPAPTARPLGQRWVREMWDSPGIGCRRGHISAGGTLASFRFNLGFRTDLCFWTNTDLKPDATANGVANRLYSSVYKCTWTPDFEIKFHPVTGVGTITTAKKITVTKDKSAANGHAVAVDGFGLETRRPHALGWYAVDART